MPHAAFICINFVARAACRRIQKLRLNKKVAVRALASTIYMRQGWVFCVYMYFYTLYTSYPRERAKGRASLLPHSLRQIARLFTRAASTIKTAILNSNCPRRPISIS
jgi:hypothetical protein